jgi:hypothetical protein
MAGLEGTMLRTKDALRLVIGVELLQRSIAVELDREAIAPRKEGCGVKKVGAA